MNEICILNNDVLMDSPHVVQTECRRDISHKVAGINCIMASHSSAVSLNPPMREVHRAQIRGGGEVLNVPWLYLVKSTNAFPYSFLSHVLDPFNVTLVYYSQSSFETLSIRTLLQSCYVAHPLVLIATSRSAIMGTIT